MRVWAIQRTWPPWPHSCTSATWSHELESSWKTLKDVTVNRTHLVNMARASMPAWPCRMLCVLWLCLLLYFLVTSECAHAHSCPSCLPPPPLWRLAQTAQHARKRTATLVSQDAEYFPEQGQALQRSTPGALPFKSSSPSSSHAAEAPGLASVHPPPAVSHIGPEGRSHSSSSHSPRAADHPRHDPLVPAMTLCPLHEGHSFHSPAVPSSPIPLREAAPARSYRRVPARQPHPHPTPARLPCHCLRKSVCWSPACRQDEQGQQPFWHLSSLASQKARVFEQMPCAC